jgi:hypothetical protein
VDFDRTSYSGWNSIATMHSMGGRSRGRAESHFAVHSWQGDIRTLRWALDRARIGSIIGKGSSYFVNSCGGLLRSQSFRMMFIAQHIQDHASVFHLNDML